MIKMGALRVSVAHWLQAAQRHGRGHIAIQPTCGGGCITGCRGTVDENPAQPPVGIGQQAAYAIGRGQGGHLGKVYRFGKTAKPKLGAVACGVVKLGKCFVQAGVIVHCNAKRIGNIVH